MNKLGREGSGIGGRAAGAAVGRASVNNGEAVFCVNAVAMRGVTGCTGGEAGCADGGISSAVLPSMIWSACARICVAG